MNASAIFDTVAASISDVERDTGLAKETLRVWERRYDFPRPVRDAFGERRYPAEQVAKLRLVKRLIDLGHRPGRVIGLPPEQLQDLAAQRGNGAIQRHPELDAYLELCRQHQMAVFRRKLTQAVLLMGIKQVVTDLVAPLVNEIGDAWACGRLAVYEEHLFTESLQIVLRGAIFSVPQVNHSNGAARPRILLTTLPQERHGLGLLMAEALFAAEGAHCISLGVQTPVPDIVEAARVKQADIVALSFSSGVNPRQVSAGLRELHARLPAGVALWAGGNNPALQRRPPAFVQVCALAEVGARIADWRSRQAPPAAS